MFVVFPGQGSQNAHMGKAFINNAEVMKYTEAASKITGKDIQYLIMEADDNELNKTENAQIAIFVLNYALFKSFEAQFSVQAFAGHSLGEYIALACAGVLSFEDACRLIIFRSKLMQEVEGKMLAVLNMSHVEANIVCSMVSDVSAQELCFIANYNSSTQIVLSGHEKAIARAQEVIKQMAQDLNKRSMKSIILPVSGPFHTLYMKAAADKFNQLLNEIELHEPKTPVISNLYVKTDVDWKKVMKLHMCAPVRWQETLEYMNTLDSNAQIFEVGATSLLTNMAKRDGYNMSYVQNY